MSKLRIAIQKSGRLSEGSMQLIKECGISISLGRKDKLIAEASNFPVEVLFLRDDDIPEYVEDEVADVGILGENVVEEKNKDIKVVERLGFSKCRLSLAVPKNIDYRGIDYFHKKRIATSYPVTTQKFLKKNGLSAEIHEISGSVEIATGIGLADAISDIVSSGSTLFSNGLQEVETILRSEAVMVSNPNLSHTKQEILDKLLFRIRSINKAKTRKYIVMNAPNEKIEKICTLLPGMNSPTIMPLHIKGWSSIHSAVETSEFWGVIDKLKEYGAEGILVVPVEKMF